MKLKLIVALVALTFAVQANANKTPGRNTTDPKAAAAQGDAHLQGQKADSSQAKSRSAKVRTGLAQKGLLNESVPAQQEVAKRLESLMQKNVGILDTVLAIVANKTVTNDIKTKQLILLSVAEAGDVKTTEKGEFVIAKKSTEIGASSEKARIQVVEIATLVATEISKFQDGSDAKKEATEMLTLVAEAILQGDKTLEEALKSAKQNVIEMICSCTGRCG